jgi:hypothetical protein
MQSDSVNPVGERPNSVSGNLLDFPTTVDRGSLPRLLYLGNVPVEAYMHGSTLLYRLFETYPKEKLLIVEHTAVSRPERRIPGGQYRAIVPPGDRLMRNRFSKHLWPLAALGTHLYSGALRQMVRSFQPQAVITVVVGHGWEFAAHYASRNSLPLHLIVHDDSPNNAVTAWQRRWVDRAIRRWYLVAASRLCISPYMAEEYGRRYGGRGDVLYPARGPQSLAFDAPPERLGGACKPFTVAFCGSIYLEYARALQRMAIALQDIGGRLLVFGPKPYDAVGAFLRESNIELQGTISSSELVRRCREQADAMFVPMSYRESDRHNMEISFPSKLVDCTAAGLPLIIDGPDYCSAIRWACENPGVSETVTDESVNELRAVLQRLQNPDVRLRLARESIRCGNEYFSHDRAYSTLLAKLRVSEAQRLSGQLSPMGSGSEMPSASSAGR